MGDHASSAQHRTLPARARRSALLPSERPRAARSDQHQQHERSPRQCVSTRSPSPSPSPHSLSLPTPNTKYQILNPNVLTGQKQRPGQLRSREGRCCRPDPYNRQRMGSILWRAVEYHRLRLRDDPSDGREGRGRFHHYA